MKKILSHPVKIFVLLFFCLSSGRSVNAQCSANFTFSIQNGTVSFVNTSSSTYSSTSYYWQFGDGTSLFIPPFNNSGNTVHTYSSNGIYSATLTINDSITNNCTSTIAQTIAVTSASCLGGASFTHTLLQNGVVQFNNTSSGSSLTYAWNFGDNTTSAFTSPTHTYVTDSLYTVSLVATGPSCTFSVSQTVAVTVAQCLVNSSFTSATVSGGQVNFTNTSSNSTGTNVSSYWSFGDGSYSTSHNAAHTYTANGQYYVTLTMTAIYGYLQCIDTTGAPVNITNAPCSASAGFNMAKDSVIPLTWNIFPAVTGGLVTGALWNWGDGSSSASLFPSHTYSAAGTYSICLTVTVTCATGTATANHCSASSIYKMAGRNSMINVRVIDPANPVGIADDPGLADIKIYPNPSSGIFRLESGDIKTDIFIKVTNLLGREIYTDKWGAAEGIREINLSETPAGIYFIKVKSGTGEMNKRVLLER